MKFDGKTELGIPRLLFNELAKGYSPEKIEKTDNVENLEIEPNVFARLTTGKNKQSLTIIRMGDKRIILFHVWTARKESNEPVAIRFKQDINFAIDDQLSGLMITIWKAADEALFKDEKIHKADLDFEECLKRG